MFAAEEREYLCAQRVCHRAPRPLADQGKPVLDLIAAANMPSPLAVRRLEERGYLPNPYRCEPDVRPAFGRHAEHERWSRGTSTARLQSKTPVFASERRVQAALVRPLQATT
ncbi:MAG: hypothetical protein ACREXY_12865 [Gammaproteobacteria bacterium]